MIRKRFRQFATWSADVVGSPWAFLVSIGLILAWVLSGPRFQYSENWQLVMNTGTNVITFLMVFLIQAMQNRDSKVMQLKLDELLRAVKSARTHLVSLEQMSDAELDDLQAEFQRLRERLIAGNSPAKKDPPESVR
jgi:low affinity Fe/Cu permease